MSDDRIDIEVTDKIAPGIQRKLNDIADSADRADSAVERLREALGSLQGTALSRLQTSLQTSNTGLTRQALLQQKLATEVQKTNAAYLKNEQALNKAIAAEQRAAAATQKLIAEQQKAAAATARAEAATQRLQQQQERHNASMKRGAETHQAVVSQINNVGKSAQFTRQQLLTFQYTFNDVVASLGSGISPMTILMQQGGQVTQAFGGLGNTLRMVGNAMLTAKGAVAGLAVGIGVLALATLDAHKEMGTLNGTLRVTGNYAGITGGQYLAMGEQIAAAANVSKSAARDVVTQLAATGQFQKAQIEQLATSTLLLGTYTGQTTKEIIDGFKNAAKAPTEYAQSLNAQFNFLSSRQIAHIRELEAMGQKTKAFEEVTKALYEYLGQNGPQNLGYLESGWHKLGIAISNAWDKMKQWGRAKTGGEVAEESAARIRRQMQENQQRIKNLGGDNAKGYNVGVVDGLKAQNTELQKSLTMMELQRIKTEENAAATSAMLKDQKDGAEASGRLANNWNDLADNTRAASREIAAFRADIDKALKANPNDQEALSAKANAAKIEQAIREKHSSSLKKNATEYENASKQANEYIATLKREAAEAEEVEGRQIALNAAKEAAKAPQAAQKAAIMQEALALIRAKQAWKEKQEAEAAYIKHAVAFESNAEKIWQEVEALKHQNAHYEMLASTVTQTAIEKTRAQLTSLELTERETSALENQLLALQALRSEQLKREGKERATDLRNEFKKTSEDVSTWLRDGIREGFTSGGSFVKSFFNSIKAAASNLVLNPIIQPLGQAGASMLNPAAAAAAGQAGSSALGGAFSAVSGVTSAASLFSSTIATGFMNTIAGTGISAGLGAGSAMIANGAIAQGLGMMAGSLGPIAIALAVIAKGLSSKTVGSGILGTATDEGFEGNSYVFKRGGWLKGGSKTNLSAIAKAQDQAFDKTATSLADNFKKLGQSLGAGSETMKDFSFEFRLALADFDEAGKEKEVGRLMSAMADSAAMQFVDNFRTSIDTAAKAAQAYFTNTIDGQRTFEGGVVSKQRTGSNIDAYADDMIRIFDAFRASVEGVQGAEGQLSDFTTKLFGLGNELAKNNGLVKQFGEALTFTKLEAVAEGSETVVDTFARLNNVFGVTNAVAEIMGKDTATAFAVIGLASTAARQNLIDLAGGIEALTSKTQFFAQEFLTEAERLAPTQKLVTQRMLELGNAGVKTHEQFKALVLSQDLSTEAGRKMYASLMEIAPAFDLVADAAKTATETAAAAAAEATKIANDKAKELQNIRNEQLDNYYNIAKTNAQNALSALGDSLNNAKLQAQAAHDAQIAIINAQKTAAEELYQQQKQTLTKQADLQNDTVGKLQTLVNAVDNALDSYRIAGSGAAYRQQAQAQISAARAMAAAGIMPTAESLQSALRTVTQPSEDLYTDFNSYAEDFYKTANDINDLSGYTNAQLSIEQRSLDTLKAQLESLDRSYELQQKGFEASAEAAREFLEAETLRFDQMYSNAEKQLKEAEGQSTTLLSISSAQTNLAGAIQQLATARVNAPSASGGYAGGGGQTAAQTTNRQFVESLYGNLLGRQSDAEGLQFWTSALDRGHSASEIINGFLNSSEYKGSHAGGLSRVPYNDYPANLHAGERVLTASEARDYNAGYNEQVVAKIDQLITAIELGNGPTVANLNKISKDIAEMLEIELERVDAAESE